MRICRGDGSRTGGGSGNDRDRRHHSGFLLHLWYLGVLFDGQRWLRDGEGGDTLMLLGWKAQGALPWASRDGKREEDLSLW